MITAVGMLEQELLIPNLFQKQGVDQFSRPVQRAPRTTPELATIAGVSDAKVWTPAGYKAETDPANA